MKKTLLFAVDLKTQETIISETEKGSNKVNFIERIHRTENELLFDAAVALTKATNPSNFDVAIFKALDKVCQMIYEKQNEIKPLL